ncbi:hypothetical protein AGMMS49975_08120 [Clostridia bacterium]|nr:hypothetical protein AGMMS49975_08120 [Clostridia bacterium]
MPPFIGNTIRGALGQSMYDNFRNVYDAVFKVSFDESAPNPFVVSAPYPSDISYKKGGEITFCVTLFGLASAYEVEITNAARLMCNGKLANSELIGAERVYSREWSDAGSVPDCSALTLKFISPTEIRHSKGPVFEPNFSAFIDSLFGRIYTIIDNYTNNEFVIPYSLVVKKPLVQAEYAIEQVRVNSNNQPINGFIGEICYFGDITRYLPYVDLGSQLHIGKKTTRGCGEYIFEV